MPSFSRSARRVLALLSVVAATAVVAGCSEKLDAGAACPLLCPQQQVPLQDTIIDAVVADTSIPGYPAFAQESYLLLAARGDTLDTRVIVRYDTIPSKYTAHVGGDSDVTKVDSAYIWAHLFRPDTTKRQPAPITIQLYDVDPSPTDTVSRPDTAAALLLPLFRPDRLIGSNTFAPESVTDSLRLRVSDSAVLAHAKSGKRLRIGMRLVSSKPTELSFLSTENTGPMTLSFRASPDTQTSRVTVSPQSRFPTEPSFLASTFVDFVITARGPPPPPPSTIGVGGYPSRRAYLRFDLPSRILDSANVVRATLFLDQRRNPASPASRDTTTVFAMAILAAPTVTDIGRALSFVSAPGAYGLDSIRTTPADSGVRTLQLVTLLNQWRAAAAANATTGVRTPQALALRSGSEGSSGAMVEFYSASSVAALRPRLRITYVPKFNFGQP